MNGDTFYICASRDVECVVRRSRLELVDDFDSIESDKLHTLIESDISLVHSYLLHFNILGAESFIGVMSSSGNYPAAPSSGKSRFLKH